MAKGGKKRQKVRKRQWDADDLNTFSGEQRRFRGRDESRDVVHTPLAETFDPIEPNAVIAGPYGLLAFVCMNGEQFVARVDERLTNGKTSFLAPGDDVLVERRGDEWFVQAVAPRRTRLSRPAIMKNRPQTLAANVDVLVVVAAAKHPAFRPGLVDRFLIAAQRGGVEPILCVNKMDLVQNAPEPVEAYRRLGLPVFETSCAEEQGIAQLRDYLTGKTGVFSGHSGVGKSSLVNALDPSHGIVTSGVSESTSKGRHTTTSARLYELEGGIRIIDTPGIRELGLWEVTPETVGKYFPEIAEAAEHCKFRDCSHTHEPHCAVQEKMESGDISRLRYESYLRIRDSVKT